MLCAFVLGVILFAPGLRAAQTSFQQLRDQVLRLYRQDDYPKAVPIALEEERAAKTEYGPKSPQLALALDDLARIYKQQGKYAEAEVCLEQALAIDKNAPHPNPVSVARDLDDQAMVYNHKGKYVAAERNLKLALAMEVKALGPENTEVAEILDNLATVYDAAGKYALSEADFERALSIDEKKLKPGDPNLAVILARFGGLYGNEGKFAKSEPLLKRALAVAQKSFGPDGPATAPYLNSLAVLYWEEGKYAQSEILLKQTLTINERTFGPNNLRVGSALANLAVLYDTEGKPALAEPLYKRGLAIDVKVFGPNNPAVATDLNNLAVVYDEQGEREQAEGVYKRALAIDEKALGPDHPDVAREINNLAWLYGEQHQYAAAQRLYAHALAIDEKTLGPEHPTVAWLMGNLAIAYFAGDRPREAQKEFARSLAAVHGILLHQFSYMSEAGRLRFLKTVSDEFPAYFTFVRAYHRQSPALSGRMYDVLLWEKGIVASGVAALERRIETGGNPENIALFEKLRAVRTKASNLMFTVSANLPRRQQELADLETQANGIERQLAQRSATFAEHEAANRATWQAVRNALRPGEAAVEYVRYPVLNSNSYTGKSAYAALVLRPGSEAPTYIALGDAKSLEGKPVASYSRWVRRPTGAGSNSAGAASPAFYDAFWKPLLPALGQAKTIYVAPDGVLDQVALGVVPTPGGKLLMDRYDLRIVDSTRDVPRRSSPATTATAVLVGDPRFDMPARQWSAALQNVRTGAAGTTLAGERVANRKAAAARPGALPAAEVKTELGLNQNCDPLPPPGGITCPLPGTRGEVTAIAGALQREHWNVRAYLGRNAIEEAVISAKHPRLLLLATHGFFFSTPQTMQKEIFGESPGASGSSGPQNPMLLSGLLFAGVDRSRMGFAPPAGAGSGVLTAYDASTLNLQGTQLVVLSACDTGLGKVEAGEGVFGLRRAFEEAGAQSVLMSMWAVPAVQTEQLMKNFIANWLGAAGKPPMSEHAALRLAQETLRKQVRKQYGRDIPYYWGAWVLAGR